ncbi:sporulation protein YunB [Thermoanaerobacterium thermosaccharolyticum]|jgi:sporulation protein YunB|uniref:Sporulation protein YunB n=2 Tax=Thermoanaerobacterium thermosaccharolyticum TaxID=1517 RepID=A0A223HVD7_THETR|nr:sporulation protein YunB [Thermoanaerobacterium thermosaccharolyticum]AGB19423.1 sporulation protein YunB [Thermoanaerobacterium thermosaccharolyticum M0795]AST56429.1 sporulation protein YunB [Thermoanaerobacterium thermosaccharolyticum]KAA5807290.1 sporulation protein YunB [Thermoanaerobacterium thermosaccharolyticum]MBE0068867.1 sporulation protein YunB [Thermoanaerobacterium thermosaccharolyticum]MBE0228740.1 sporulation protein YunB [Thermoanaerobacterium thermosaccharolyticum]
MRRKRWGRRRLKLYEINKNYIYIFLIFFLISIIYSFVAYRLRPALLKASETVAQEVAVKSINKSINEKVLKGIQYNDLINVRTDKNGKVSMLQANTIEMNILSTKITQAVQDNLNSIGSVYVKLPLGSLISKDIFANTGPRIKVGLLPIGSVYVDFQSSFEPAGINQTRHIIYLYINTNIQIIAPLASKQIQVSTHMPIADSIIVGDVPASYVDVNGNKYTVPVPNGDSKINIESN